MRVPDAKMDRHPRLYRKDIMAQNKEWPDGILSRVSREAYNAIRRGRAFPYQTPERREEAARSYDKMFGLTPSTGRKK